MVFNLIREKWIWVKRQDGTYEKIAPWMVTDQLESNPFVSLFTQRADFNGSLIQFMIGLVQTTMSPINEREWRKYFTSPPKPEELKEKFEKVSEAFDLDGEKYRFMQDLEDLEGVENRVDALLVEMPGEQTLKHNADHFLKRDTVEQMCFPCCATALFNLQLNAPSGGQGHRTSLRGGGPLTTLVLGNNLWQTIWLNIVLDENFTSLGDVEKREIGDIFPWMKPTRSSETKGGKETTPMDVNPKQMYWGMPRRIRLCLDENFSGICDVCGHETERTISNYIAKNYGVNYTGAWRHVLTPYQETKDAMLPRHPQPGGFSYRHWLGLVQTDPDKGFHPSLALEKFRSKQRSLADLDEVFKYQAQLWSFGYDFDNMKVRCWYESTMPLLNVPDGVRSAYETAISQLIKTAEAIGINTRGCIKQALYGSVTLRGDLSFIDARFWHDTEPFFYSSLSEMATLLENGQDVVELKLKWIRHLKRVSENLFDEYSQSMQFSVVDPERVSKARRDLRRYNSEGGKKIRDILGLPKMEK